MITQEPVINICPLVIAYVPENFVVVAGTFAPDNVIVLPVTAEPDPSKKHEKLNKYIPEYGIVKSHILVVPLAKKPLTLVPATITLPS